MAKYFVVFTAAPAPPHRTEPTRRSRTVYAKDAVQAVALALALVHSDEIVAEVKIAPFASPDEVTRFDPMQRLLGAVALSTLGDELMHDATVRGVEQGFTRGDLGESIAAGYETARELLELHAELELAAARGEDVAALLMEGVPAAEIVERMNVAALPMEGVPAAEIVERVNTDGPEGRL